MDNLEIINKIQKYSVNSIYSENENKIGIKIYSNIGLWIYLIINKNNYSCKYTTAVETVNKKRVRNNLWNLISLNDFYKIFIRPKFKFIKLSNNKLKGLKNIKSDYSVKCGDYKIQIFVKDDDVYACFPKFAYNIKSCCYFKLQNFKQLYLACCELSERPEMILKMFLTRKYWEITAKGKTNIVNLDDYLTNRELLEFFSEIVIKYGENKCQVQKSDAELNV